MKKITFGLILCLLLFYSIGKNNNSFLDNEQNSILIFQNVASSIVHVSNMRTARNWLDMDETTIEAGAGSGLVWDEQGHIITNYHVIHGGDSFLIFLKEDKKQYRAKLVGSDPRSDLAVLKLEERPKKLYPIIIGESKNLQVGQKALAIGNPLGLDHTLTTGSISALNRKIRGYGGVSIQGMIQTDASINPGNSGGALLDSHGRLIGINSMIFNAAGVQASAGLGFAIPVDNVKKIVPQLIKYGRVIRPGLGIALLEEHYAAQLGLREGVMIKYVDTKGPAGKAGLRGIRVDKGGKYYIGDIIIAIDANPIKDSDDLFTALEGYRIGAKVKIKYIRDNLEKVVEIALVQI